MTETADPGTVGVIDLAATGDDAASFDEECALETLGGDVVMWGHDYGGANFTESPDYYMAGTALKAFGGFADLVGRPMMISGVVGFGEVGPEAAPGQIVIG